MKQEILKYKDEMIDQLAQLVSYPSTYQPNQDNTPFGISNRDCLNKAWLLQKNN